MVTIITLSSDDLHQLNLTPAQTVIEELLQDPVSAVQSPALQFQIEYPRTPDDPRELSEIDAIRLWFIRLDSRYPWLPILLDWKTGELARYTAMLVPHQFHRTEGIQYNPEALEIFLMHKVFAIADWLQELGIPRESRLTAMAQMLGYDLDDAFFALI